MPRRHPDRRGRRAQVHQPGAAHGPLRLAAGGARAVPVRDGRLRPAGRGGAGPPRRQLHRLRALQPRHGLAAGRARRARPQLHRPGRLVRPHEHGRLEGPRRVGLADAGHGLRRQPVGGRVRAARPAPTWPRATAPAPTSSTARPTRTCGTATGSRAASPTTTSSSASRRTSRAASGSTRRAGPSSAAPRRRRSARACCRRSRSSCTRPTAC